MKNIKILCIGNSFSDDMTYLSPQVFKGLGYDCKIGNLFIGGCTLSTHLKNAKSGEVAYDYFVNEGTVWTQSKASLIDALHSEAWDIITMQQASGFSGIAETYRANLWDLVEFVTRNVSDAKSKLYWHKTWSYAKGSDHPHFRFYGNDQNCMDQAIDDCVRNEVLPTGAFSGIIATGDVIKAGREIFNDSLTRDGFHLSVPLGRYLAALVFAFTATEEYAKDPMTQIDGISASQNAIAVKCVKNTMKGDETVGG